MKFTLNSILGFPVKIILFIINRIFPLIGYFPIDFKVYVKVTLVIIF